MRKTTPKVTSLSLSLSVVCFCFSPFFQLLFFSKFYQFFPSISGPFLTFTDSSVNQRLEGLQAFISHQRFPHKPPRIGYRHPATPWGTRFERPSHKNSHYSRLCRVHPPGFLIFRSFSDSIVQRHGGERPFLTAPERAGRSSTGSHWPCPVTLPDPRSASGRDSRATSARSCVPLVYRDGAREEPVAHLSSCYARGRFSATAWIPSHLWSGEFISLHYIFSALDFFSS